MKIGLDIDDVITNTSEVIESYVLKDKNSEKLQKHMKAIMKGNPTDPEVVSFCMNMYVDAFRAVQPIENAIKVINNLMDQGNEVYLITARGDELDYFKGSEEVTKNFLKNNNVKYSKLIFNAVDKAQLCLDNNIDLMIDDSVEHCEDVANVGVQSIVYTTKVNRDTPTNIDRVNDWLELESEILKRV